MLCSPLDNPEYVTGLSPSHMRGEQRQFREIQMHNYISHTHSMSMVFASANGKASSLWLYGCMLPMQWQHGQGWGGGGGGGGGGGTESCTSPPPYTGYTYVLSTSLLC